MNGQSVTPDQNPLPLVLHLVGGQVVIGQVSLAADHTINVEKPYEVMATPSEHTQRATISLVPYGTLLGVMPQIGPQKLVMQFSALVALPVAPHPELFDAFRQAAFPDAERQIQEAKQRRALFESQFDITKGGTL